MYKTLSADHVIATVDALSRRVQERFPEASLFHVSSELCAVARQMRADAAALGLPNWRLRTILALILAAGGASLVMAIGELRFNAMTNEAVTIVQVVEPAANIAILVAIGIVFLVRSEERWKQKRALNSLNALRSMIHVVDMHQLTKDPSVLLADFKPTASSPVRTMSQAELVRYLDYCSEMLSLVGKLAALYAQTMQDSAVIQAVNDIEALATNLSRKIWQKIMIIDQFTPEQLRPPG